MSDTTVKRTVRTRKTLTAPTVSSESSVLVSPKAVVDVEETFSSLVSRITEAKNAFISLKKEIEEAKETWAKEQKTHEEEISGRNQQEEVARKREQEAYEYETTKRRRQEEDEFLEKKAKWENELKQRREEIENDKKELDLLRKQVAGFEEEKEKVVKEACATLQKQLQETFTTERKIREQEIKAEKELLLLKITNLTQENARQANEISVLKKSLENATMQLKDVAVKVIESSGASQKTSVSLDG